jgi:hypothetical protein
MQINFFENRNKAINILKKSQKHLNSSKFSITVQIHLKKISFLFILSV